MSALLDFVNWVKAAGPSIAAGARSGAKAGVSGGTPAKEQTSQRQAEVTKRLAALIGPCKEAVLKNGPAAAQLKLQMDLVKKDVVQRDFDQAVRNLDALERFVQHAKTQNLNGALAVDPDVQTTPLPLQTGTTSAAPAGPGGGSAGAAGGGSAANGSGQAKVRDLVDVVTIKPPPNATSTDFFFNFDDDKLTDSDIKSLDAYAADYLAAKSSTKIHVKGWASKEGQEQHNKGLSQRRADRVANYLKTKGVLVAEAKGQGPTDKFSTSDLGQNRRVTVDPPPPRPAIEIPESLAPVTPPPAPPEETPEPSARQDGKPAKKKPESDDDDNPKAAVVGESKLHGGSSSDPKNSVSVELKYTVKLRATDGSWELIPNVELTLSVGKDGKLGPVAEAQLNIIKREWENLKIAGKTFSAEISLSLNGEAALAGDKLESIKATVQAELEIKLSKRTSLKFDVKQEKAVYDNPSAVTPPERDNGPQITGGITVQIGGGGHEKKEPVKETAEEKENRREVSDAISRNWKEYEKARDAVVSKLKDADALDQATKEMNRAARDEDPFVASDDLKAKLKAEGRLDLEVHMKKVVKNYEDKINAQEPEDKQKKHE